MPICKFFTVGQNSRTVNVGLLVWRVCVGASLFVNHGWEKLFGFSRMLQFGMNPIHIGVYPTLLYATLSDGIGSLLIIIGLVTRAAALVIVVSLSVVYFVMLHALSLLFYHAPAGPPPLHGPPPGHVELVFLYLSSFLSILIAGPGRFSLDGWLSRMRQPEKNAAGA